MSAALPELTSDEKMALSAICIQGLFNPKFAANFYIDPHPVFEIYDMSRIQITQIVHYFRWINDRCRQMTPEERINTAPPKDEFSANELIQRQQSPSLSFKEKEVLLVMIHQILNDPEFGVKFITDSPP